MSNLNDYHGNGFIGGIMMFNITRMKYRNWEIQWRNKFQEFRSTQPDAWYPKLNDQDVFNAILSTKPEWAYPLPCEWNLQYHAYMNAIRLCGRDSGTLNCKKLHAEKKFVCPKRPAVVHFMAQSYFNNIEYYSTFWKTVELMPVSLIVDTIKYTNN